MSLSLAPGFNRNTENFSLNTFPPGEFFFLLCFFRDQENVALMSNSPILITEVSQLGWSFSQSTGDMCGGFTALIIKTNNNNIVIHVYASLS